MIVQAIRSALFYLAFIGQTAVLAVILGGAALLAPKGRPAPRWMWGIGRYWGRSNLLFLRLLVGIRSRVEGTENLPAGGCIIASKHQSDWDIIALLPHAPLPAFIAKRQLLDIPFFGWAARTLNTISVDRARGGEALAQMLRDAREKLEHGSQIIIFPEGTRKAPLAPADYRFGVTRLYLANNVPVVPVAVNSGLFWGRNSPVLWPGTARARFLAPIPPGLGQAEFQQRLVETIERGTAELILEAYREGLSRPLNGELRARLDELARETPAAAAPIS